MRLSKRFVDCNKVSNPVVPVCFWFYLFHLPREQVGVTNDLMTDPTLVSIMSALFVNLN